jgi:hypothetical protein
MLLRCDSASSLNLPILSWGLLFYLYQGHVGHVGCPFDTHLA